MIFINNFVLGFLPLAVMLGLNLLAYTSAIEMVGVQQKNFIYLHMPAFYFALLVGTFVSLRLFLEKYSMPNSRNVLSNILSGTGLSPFLFSVFYASGFAKKEQSLSV